MNLSSKTMTFTNGTLTIPFRPDPPAGKSLRMEDHTAIEAGRLLEDVRRALDIDFDTATKTAERLAALLAGKLRDDSCSSPARGGLAPWQKRKIQNYIDDKLEESLPVGVLAKLVSLSPSYFCRAFKESFGEPPHAYVIKMRVERAKMLMLTTSESLSQIALACGLVDQAHLCRCFRQVTGATPGAWRRSHAMEPQSADRLAIVDHPFPGKLVMSSRGAAPPN